MLLIFRMSFEKPISGWKKFAYLESCLGLLKREEMDLFLLTLERNPTQQL